MPPLPSPWKPASAGASTGTSLGWEKISTWISHQRRIWTSRRTLRTWPRPPWGREGSCYHQVPNLMEENNLTSSVTNTIENIKCFQYSHTLQRWYLILRSQKPLLDQDQASRPPGGGGGSSFSLPSSAASPLHASPPRWREYASEAGSPILEQVLLMSRHSAGTPSPAGAGYGSLNHERTTRSSSPQLKTLSWPTSLPSSMARHWREPKAFQICILCPWGLLTFQFDYFHSWAMNKFITCIVPQSYFDETFCRPAAPGLGKCPLLLYCRSQLVLLY